MSERKHRAPHTTLIMEVPVKKKTNEKKTNTKGLKVKTNIKAGGKGDDIDDLLNGLGGSDELKKMAGL